MTELRNQLTKEKARSLFTYKEGKLLWKEDQNGRTKAGSRAGCLDEGSGYRRVKMSKIRYKEHVVIWNYHYGLIPEGYTVDHKVPGKENKADNRIENLRLATPLEQSKNVSLSSRNKTGHTGIQFIKRKKKDRWLVQICVNYKNTKVGLFDTLEEAIQARKNAEKEYWS